jgi:tetratricopeptide (TPR) repeat protein
VTMSYCTKSLSRASLGILAMLVAIQPLKADSLAEALREQRYDAALQFADAALKNRPGDVFLMIARGLALGGMKRTGESLQAFEAVLKINPEFISALKGAAQVSYTARDPRAPSFLKRLIGLDSTDATAHSMAGVLAFEAGDYLSAAVQFEAGRVETESNSQAYAIYGSCLVKLHRAKEAVTVFERLHRKNPESTAILRSLASAQAAAGTPEVAAATLRRALEAGPGEEQTYVDLAALYILNNAGDLALSTIQAGLEKLPQSARIYSLRGVVEAEKGMEADATRDFAISTRLDPDGQYGSAGLGVLYMDTGRAAEASEILRRRLQKSPSDPTLNYLLARALVREGATPGTPTFREAEAALLAATRIRSDYAAAHTALGKLYAQSGDDARAIAEFQVALSLNGSDRAALNQLAGLLRRAGRIGEATELTRRLRQLVIGEAESVPSR